jgi:ABC-type branched-subunit amino acid transport system substrate-binding protein
VARSFALSLFAALALAIPSAAADSPGVTGDTVLIGGTVPLSGPASFYAPIAVGAKAYFDYVNSKGGVNGRKIDYRYLDDQYNPGMTVQLTRQLVEQDRVFAIFNSAGTEQNLAVREYLNQQKVPQLFVGSALGDWKRAPYTIGYLPSFYAEGRIYGRRIAATLPNAKVAVLYEKTPFGQQMLDGLRAGLGKKAKNVVAAEGTNVTDTDVSSALAQLRGSKADVLAVFELPKQALQSFISADKLGWRPHFYVSAISIDPAVMAIARFNTQGRTTEGATSIAWLKDPTAPRWQKDKGVKLYLAIMKSFAPADASPGAVAHFYGMAAAFTMVDALRKAGKNLTRDSLMNAARALNEKDNPFMIPGIVIKTGPHDYFPVDQAQVYTFKKDRWQPVGPLIKVAA